MKYNNAIIEILDTLTAEEIKKAIENYQMALEAKEAWDRLTEEQKDKIWEDSI